MDDQECVVLADFYTDWIALLRVQLIGAGYALRPEATEQDVSFAYFNVRKRSIDQVPRKVLRSAVLSCPDECRAALEIIQSEAETGGNLNAHLSRTLLDSNYNDPLLNDWGIHHFHLGIAMESDGFVERTGALLFARITESSIYFIDVMKHGDWTRRRLLEICIANWPELTERYKLRGVLGLTTQITEEDTAKLWRRSPEKEAF